MKSETGRKAASRSYAAAHREHYTKQDLRRALVLYQSVMSDHPDTQEAAWAHTQIQNIAHSVVPGQELLDDQARLALGYLEEGVHGSAARDSVEQQAKRDDGDETEDGVARARHNGEELRRRMALRGQ
jgi:hypothetical protein